MRLTLLILAIQSITLSWTPAPPPSPPNPANATVNINRITTGTCPSTLTGGIQIASGLTASPFTDTTVTAGSTYAYYATVVAPGMSPSPSSNCVLEAIPNPPASTTISFTTSLTNTYLTKVTAKVSSANGTPTGTIVFVFTGPQGSVTYTTTLTRQGTAVDTVATEALRLVPLVVTYQGSSTFAASTARLP